jgi:hypothetical protein
MLNRAEDAGAELGGEARGGVVRQAVTVTVEPVRVLHTPNRTEYGYSVRRRSPETHGGESRQMVTVTVEPVRVLHIPNRARIRVRNSTGSPAPGRTVRR